MSTARRESVDVSARPESGAPAGTFCVRWRISRDAAVGASLARSGAGDVVLCWSVEIDGYGAARALATLRDGDMTRVVASGSAIAEQDEHGLLHLTTPDRAFIAAIDPTGRTRVLYAHTALLAQLGIPGGRYDIVQPERGEAL